MDDIPPIVGETETITRYIMQSSHYAVTNGRVKHGAFMPASDGHTSVYRTDNLEEKEIWDMGREYVAKIRNLKLKARSDTLSKEIFTAGLKIVPDQTPHMRHANIANWPVERHKVLLAAKKIAEKATLYLNKHS